MTTEEKAKAYDEALEIARKINSGEGVAAPPDWTTCEVIFPQLKESEDERIIRAIIDALYSHTNSINLLSSRNYQMEDIEAWLEKQKVNTEGDFGRGYDCGYQAGYAVAVDEMKPKIATATLDSEKQKEQKPLEWSEDDRNRVAEYLHDRDGGMLWSKATEITSDILDILHPQSKDGLTLLDENIIKAAVAFVEQNDHFNYWGGIDKHTVIKALRSLKSHQKPVEWSEEDEAMRDNILRLLSCFVGTLECDSNPSLSTSYLVYQKEIDWLKSLKPQPKQEWSEDIIRKGIKEVGLTQYQINWLKNNVFPPKEEPEYYQHFDPDC